MAAVPVPRWSLVDIGLNLTDKMYLGTYQGRRSHPSDMAAVLSRGVECGVRGLLLTGGNRKESEKVIEMCRTLSVDGGEPPMKFFCTVGCHPTRCQEFLEDPDGYYNKLDSLISEHSVRAIGGDNCLSEGVVTEKSASHCVAAIGEIGLDYDRLFFCPKDVQIQFFRRQLDLAEKHQLPLFLHDRNTDGDFYRILSERKGKFSGGVVHSFTGTAEDLQRYLDLGLYVGVNGCSLKTEENLAVARTIPLDRLLIETDGPWCEIKNSHASRVLLNKVAGGCQTDRLLSRYPVVRKEKFKLGSRVKGRCEPCDLVQVLEVLYELHKADVSSMEELADTIGENTRKLFSGF